MKWRFCLTAILSATCGSALGEQLLDLSNRAGTVRVVPGGAPTWGTTTTSIALIPGEVFHLASGVEGTTDPATTLRQCIGGGSGCIFYAGLSLPSGVHLTSLELEACDGDDTLGLGFALLQFSPPVQPGTVVSPLGTSGGPETPGCALFEIPLDRTVDNLAEKLIVNVSLPTGLNIGFSAARVGYNLQVSPAPGTATFNDVPAGHPQFQFIEALVASGITVGCGGGNYCPDNNLTRGQMAVFLSKALGLHFPN